MFTHLSVYKRSFSFGLVAGCVLVFLSLIGFIAIIGQIVFGARFLTMPQYAIMIAICGFLAGLIAISRRQDEAGDWKPVLAIGAFTGLGTGILMILFSLAMDFIRTGGADPRTYLVKLSPQLLELYLFDAHWLIAAGLYLATLIAGGLLAGVFIKAVIQADWRKNLMERGKQQVNQLKTLPVVLKLQANKHANPIMIVVALVLLFLMPYVWGSYWNYVMGTVGIYILLGLGMNIIVGLSGQLVLGYVAFFAIGAYTMGLMTSPVPLGISLGFWPALVASVITAALTGILLGLPILNLRGDYLAIVTLGFGEIIRILIKSDSLTSLTGGPKGLRNIAKPTLFGMNFSSDVNFMHLILVGVLVGIFIAYRLQNSRTGRAWLSIQGDQIVSRATGVNSYFYKILALALGAAFAGVGGAIFASRNQFTGPEDHILMVSINVLCLVIVGGMGSLPGVVLGSFVLKGIPELLRDLTDYRLLVFGILLVVMMIARPEGLWPSGRPRIAEILQNRKIPLDEPSEEVPA